LAGGRQFSRLLAAEVCASAVVMLDTPCSEVVWRVLATHCVRQFPLHSPPVRHRVQSHFNLTLHGYRCTQHYTQIPLPSARVLLIISCFEFQWSIQIKNYSNEYIHGARVEVIMARSNGVPRNFVRGGSTNTFEDRGQTKLGFEGGSPLFMGSGCNCNLIQEI